MRISEAEQNRTAAAYRAMVDVWSGTDPSPDTALDILVLAVGKASTHPMFVALRVLLDDAVDAEKLSRVELQVRRRRAFGFLENAELNGQAVDAAAARAVIEALDEQLATGA